MSTEDSVVLQTGSSATTRRRNYDGSIPVHCSRCRRFICDVDGRNNFMTALCVLCQKVDEGVLLPLELENQIKSVRIADGRILPLAATLPDKQPDPMVDKNENVVGRINYWFKTIVANKFKQKPKEKKASKELSREKKHRPVLSGGGLVINKDYTEEE